MNEIWANRLIAGTKTWSQVPLNRKKAVEEILVRRIEDNVISFERYEEIISS